MTQYWLAVLALSACAEQAFGVRQRLADMSIVDDINSGQCMAGANARKMRNQCCHERGGRGGLDAKACEANFDASKEACESGCFMIDRSKAGGLKMCKPICEAKRLVSSDEVEDMKAEAEIAAQKAATFLVDLEGANPTSAELEEAKAEDDAAQQRKYVIAAVAEQFGQSGTTTDGQTLQESIKSEEEETFQVIKGEAVQACSDLPRNERLQCCNKECRARVEEYYPGEQRNISPMGCAIPCNND